jgi:hypothetical protein
LPVPSVSVIFAPKSAAPPKINWELSGAFGRFWEIVRSDAHAKKEIKEKSMNTITRFAAALGLAAVFSTTAVFAQMAPAPGTGKAVKGYTKTLKSGKKVMVKGYTRKAKPAPSKAVKGYTKTLKSGKKVMVKGYTRKAPMKGKKMMAPMKGKKMMAPKSTM